VGINDARGTATLANISLGFTDLYDQTAVDFPGVPIYASSIGSDELNTINDRKATVKKYQRQLADARSYYNLTVNLLSLCNAGWDLYRADDLHPTQTGCNLIGEKYSQYINYSESNKEVKQVWNAFKDTLSTAHKAAWKTWVEQLQTDGNWTLLEAFFPAIGTTTENVMVDVRNLGYAANNGYAFTANSFIRCSSTTAFRRANVFPASSWVGAGQNDFISGTKLKTNYTAAGTAAYLFGVRMTSPATAQIVAAQLATNELIYIAGDNTNATYTGVTKFQDNTLYSVYRNGTTKGLYANTTSVASTVQSTTGFLNIAIWEGVRDNAGVAGTPIDAEIEYSFQSKYTGFDMAEFNTATETLLIALRTP
jgi:hypothetical protein